MSICLINPNLIVQENDPLTTGIVYMPVTLAYVAASLREAGYPLTVIDAYGERPKQARRSSPFLIFGLTEREIIERIPEETSIAFVYAINLTNHNSTISIVQQLKKEKPHIKIVILENTQAVTAYALKDVASHFYDTGADYILTGEGDRRAIDLIKYIESGQTQMSDLDGVGSNLSYTPPKDVIKDLDSLEFPAWDLFPLENYWKLRFAHGPQTTQRYLPLLTSRGCPYPCKFCVVPATNKQKWRARSAKNVVDEIEYCINTYKVKEFHIEDLDPTISDERIQEICREIINRKLDINWKIVSGTKVETIRTQKTVELMAQSGCRYISISPETGSAKILKSMNKPFDIDHAIAIVRHMSENNIRSQACFVLGYPGETLQDLKKTWELAKRMTQEGIDEIALFIITPVPGSAIFKEFSGFKSLSELNFTPTWRKDYKDLSKFRLKLYAMFLLWKLRYHPLKIMAQPFNFLRRTFKTKMEMVPYRALVLKWIGRKAIEI